MKRLNWCIILFAALGVGVLAGAVDALFGRVLLAITAFRGAHVWLLLPFLALAGLGIILLYAKISPTAQKGMGLVFDAVRSPEAQIPMALIPLVMCSTWLTHLFGGSAGREGVAVQLGAAIGHNIGRRMGEPECARILLVTGMAAGFAGLFQTPIAAVFFALEVLTAGVLQLDILLPALIGAYTACNVSAWLGLEKFSVTIDAVQLTPETAGKCVVLAILFGLTGGTFAWLLKWAKGKCAALLSNPYWRIGVGGAVISILSLLCFAGRYSGLGTNLIDLAFAGGDIYSWDFLAKLFFTVLTLAVGIPGRRGDAAVLDWALRWGWQLRRCWDTLFRWRRLWAMRRCLAVPRIPCLHRYLSGARCSDMRIYRFFSWPVGLPTCAAEICVFTVDSR